MAAYTVSQAAEQIGLTAPTLRFYEKEGLLPFVERSSSGIRVFREADLDWLRLIACLKATGMPIKDIRQYIDWSLEGDATLEKRRQMFYERRRAVEGQIAELKKTLATVNYKCWFYDAAVEAGSAETVQRIPLDQMPEAIRQYKKSQAK